MKKSNSGSNSKNIETTKLKKHEQKAVLQSQAGLHKAKQVEKVDLQSQVSLREAFLEMDKNKGMYFSQLSNITLVGVKLFFQTFFLNNSIEEFNLFFKSFLVGLLKLFEYNLTPALKSD